MVRPAFAFAGLLLLAATSAQAAATADTGTELQSLCQAARSGGDNSVQGAKCTAYLIGLFDALRTLSMNSRDPLICPPSPVTDAKFVDAYLTWAQANPSRLAQYPVGGAIEALIQGFPCRPQQPPPPPPRRR